MFQFLLTLAIPDVPLEVQIQHERQAFIVSKAIQRLPDEDYRCVSIIHVFHNAYVLGVSSNALPTPSVHPSINPLL